MKIKRRKEKESLGKRWNIKSKQNEAIGTIGIRDQNERNVFHPRKKGLRHKLNKSKMWGEKKESWK